MLAVSLSFREKWVLGNALKSAPEDDNRGEEKAAIAG
jgi:hypothetical protein